MVNLTGYHGTIREKADKIIEENNFILSTKPTDWLGKGVYFFKDCFWADFWADMVSKKWSGKPAILQSSISCNDEEFFDLDSVDNKRKMKSCVESFSKKKSSIGAPAFKNRRELRRFYCNFYAELNNILVYSCNFPDVGFDDMGFPKSQVQYCVRDNIAVKDTKILE